MTEKIESIIKTGMKKIEPAGSLLGDTTGEAPIIAEAWGNMKYAIAQYYGVTVDKQACINTCEGIVSCLTACQIGCTFLTTSVGIIISSFIKPAAFGINVICNALLTYRIGKLYDNLYGPEKLGTASSRFGTETYKPILGSPSAKEFQDFWRIWEN